MCSLLLKEAFKIKLSVELKRFKYDSFSTTYRLPCNRLIMEHLAFLMTSLLVLSEMYSCLNFGFKDNVIDRESLIIAMKQAVNKSYFAMPFYINSISQHSMLFC